MSQIKVTNINNASAASGGIAFDADGHVTVDGLQMPTTGALSSRNLVQNGAMMVSQRGTSFDVNSEDKFTLDRFSSEWSSGTFECTVTQESDGPQGFSKSLKVACDTTYTPVTSDNFGLRTHLEGQDFQSLGFGSTGAEDITLSFYVKGTAKQYSCAVQFVDSSTNQYIQTRSFSVTSSWQRVVLTFEGNGTALNTAIVNDNTLGFVIQWWLAAGPDDIEDEDTTWVANPSPTFQAVTGQENFFDSTSNEFFITGIQLEVGNTATPFEHRSYGDELARCQRYYVRLSATSTAPYARLVPVGHMPTSSSLRVHPELHPPMRAVPTYNQSGTFGTTPSVGTPVLSLESNGSTVDRVSLIDSTGISGTQGNAVAMFASNDANAFVEFSAEL